MNTEQQTITYNETQYNFVNKRGGYTAYRNNDKPEKWVIFKDGEVYKVDEGKLKSQWSKLWL